MSETTINLDGLKEFVEAMDFYRMLAVTSDEANNTLWVKVQEVKSGRHDLLEFDLEMLRATGPDYHEPGLDPSN